MKLAGYPAFNPIIPGFSHNLSSHLDDEGSQGQDAGQGCQILVESGSDWPIIRQIGDFFKSNLSKFCTEI